MLELQKAEQAFTQFSKPGVINPNQLWAVRPSSSPRRATLLWRKSQWKSLRQEYLDEEFVLPSYGIKWKKKKIGGKGGMSRKGSRKKVKFMVPLPISTFPADIMEKRPARGPQRLTRRLQMALNSKAEVNKVSKAGKPALLLTFKDAREYENICIERVEPILTKQIR
ncbi:hypothetical protein KOW79_008182 [Hemibagrus wyckioides]|uniref:Uncharacterized protein n=1 Tax=Hemibagrus wyckioides TaxID=337641 RepID=A0A9D3NSH5_9TELE|nr:hypothetical protein KOW79_008182 [Hemibagrus wyckioides]